MSTDGLSIRKIATKYKMSTRTVPVILKDVAPETNYVIVQAMSAFAAIKHE